MPEKRDLIGHTENLVKCILLLVLLINTLENDLFFLNNAVSLDKRSTVFFICVAQNNDNNTRISTNITGEKAQL